MPECLKCKNWVESGYDICDSCRMPKQAIKAEVKTESKPKPTAKKGKK